MVGGLVPLGSHGVLSIQDQLLQSHGPGRAGDLGDLPEPPVELADIADRHIRVLIIAFKGAVWVNPQVGGPGSGAA